MTMYPTNSAAWYPSKCASRDALTLTHVTSVTALGTKEGSPLAPRETVQTTSLRIPLLVVTLARVIIPETKGSTPGTMVDKASTLVMQGDAIRADVVLEVMADKASIQEIMGDRASTQDIMADRGSTQEIMEDRAFIRVGVADTTLELILEETDTTLDTIKGMTIW